MTLVCPRCGRSFEATAGRPAACPGCGHTADAGSDFAPTLVSQDERKPLPLLVVTYAGGRREEVPLSATLSLGRAPENTLAVNDLKLSRRHLEIERRGEAWYVKDLGSSTGTLLNGQKTVDARLNPGDRVTAGDTTFEFQVRFQDTGDTDRKVRVSVGEGAPAASRVALSKERIVIGRGAECDVVLPSPVISRKHATITRKGNETVLEDLGSANGVFVNGRLVKKAALAKGDRLRIGPFVLTYDGAELAREDLQGRITLEAAAIGKKAGSVEILKDVSVVIRPNEFVGLLGPSGAGKSTFMDTLNGFRPATSGQVFVNGEDLYQIFNSFKTNIGYVPQDDIIHRELTVWDALYYTAKLRLPDDTTEEELGKLLEEVIGTLDLTERKDTRVSALSGGQRKRVSVGVELLTKPPLLFLDEPTSGLDPGTEEKIMTMFRGLAKGGRTVVLTTHVMENIELLDLIVVLVKGRLAYFGPPKEALEYFGIPKITKIYDKLEAAKPEEWAQRYLASPFNAKYVAERQAASRASAAATPPPRERKAPMPHLQLIALLRRYFATLIGDPKSLLSLLLPGPLIGFLMTLPFDSANPLHHRQLLVFMMVTAVFCGCFNSFREIVKEKAIFRRERMVNLQIIPYVLSKLILQSVFLVVGCFMLLSIVSVIEDIQGNFILHYMLLLFASVASCALGLVISALVNSSEKAIGLVIVVMIMQIIFSGGMTALSGISKALGVFMIAYWGYDGMSEVAKDGGAVILGDMVMTLLFAGVFTAATMGILRAQDVR
ncbi:MAG: FHA domain-containing protein [Planctomycetes bacterium]|nr:FHA domain-containing protein [Planctomycetota bacterium]